MSSLTYNYSFLFIVFSTFLLSCINTLPIPYDSFIEYLTDNNCTMPEQIVDNQFFPSSDLPADFSYLSNPLSECKTPDALRENSEAKFLCEEIFDVLQNITCVEYNTTLPKIKSKTLSQNICTDFKSMQGIFPSKDNYLSGKLVDVTLCRILCSEEKYALLCKMLLWSHDIQAKIKSATANLAQDTPNSDKEINKMTLKQNVADSYAGNTKNPDGTDSNNLESHSTGTSSTTNQTVLVKINNSTNNQNEFDRKTIMPEMSVSPQTVSEADNQKVHDMQSLDFNIKRHPADNIDQNEIKDDIPPNNKIAKQISDNVITSTASLISEVNSVKSTTKNTSIIIPQNKGNKTAKSNTSTKTNDVAQNSATDNNLIDSNNKGVNEKAKQTNLIKAENDKKVEKPELADLETPEPIRSSPDILDSKQIESTTLQILPEKDKNVEHQEDPEQYSEEYNENEKEDYPKPEYDNSFSPPLKNKEPSDKISVKESSNQMLNSYETFISSRNGIGHGHDNIPVIPSFPEQEDSHFFFYFLSIVLILMAGYLIFHNKQKIIALIVEGRHERRRRSHGAGYKKLETK